MRRFVGISLAIHAVLLALFVYRDAVPEPFFSRPLEFEIVTMKKAGVDGAATESGNGKNLSLRMLGPRVIRDFGDGVAGGRRGQLGKGREDGYDVAESIGTSAEADLYPFVRAVWQKIDAKVVYPDDFVKKRWEGTVTVHFEIDRRGVFTGRFARVDSESPFLKAYTLAVLVHALKEPLRTNLWGKVSRMMMVGRFQFSLFGPGQSPQKRELPHFKNILVFERKAYAEPIVNEAINRFFAKYFPPIIPIPGGFFVDFVRAYQMFASIGAPNSDEIQGQHLETLKRQWEGVVQEKATEP